MATLYHSTYILGDTFLFSVFQSKNIASKNLVRPYKINVLVLVRRIFRIFWLKAGVLFLQGLAAHPVTAIMWGIKSMDAQKWTCTCPLCWYFHHAQKEELIIPY